MKLCQGVRARHHPSSLPRPGSIISPGAAPVSLGCNPVTGVHWTDHEICWGAPSQPEMQNLVRVEILALEFEWGALQAHEKGDKHFARGLPIGLRDCVNIPFCCVKIA